MQIEEKNRGGGKNDGTNCAKRNTMIIPNRGISRLTKPKFIHVWGINIGTTRICSLENERGKVVIVLLG